MGLEALLVLTLELLTIKMVQVVKHPNQYWSLTRFCQWFHGFFSSKIMTFTCKFMHVPLFGETWPFSLAFLHVSTQTSFVTYIYICDKLRPLISSLQNWVDYDDGDVIGGCDWSRDVSFIFQDLQDLVWLSGGINTCVGCASSGDRLDSVHLRIRVDSCL